MARILVVEDDQRISDLIALYLRNEGHEVIRAYDGMEGVRLSGLEDPDLILLDLMLPRLHGRDAAVAIRRRSSVPILMLTALDDERDVVEGLDVGADDYITKPFQPSVLLARVRAALRRSQGAASIIQEIQVGDMLLVPEERSLQIEGETIDLRAKEYSLLLTLAGNPYVVHTREQLLDQVWDGEHGIDSRTVDVHINRLRARVGHSSVEIETVRGLGYRLAPPEGRSG